MSRFAVASSSSYQFLHSAMTRTRLSLATGLPASTTSGDISPKKTERTQKVPSAIKLYVKDFFAKHKNRDEPPFTTFAKARQSWSALSPAEKAPWQKKLAELDPQPVKNRLGPRSNLSGYQLFMKENLSERPETRSIREHFKDLSEQWKSLSFDKKQHYTEMGKQQAPLPKGAKVGVFKTVQNVKGKDN